jgi:hypothetical protein
MAVEGRIQSAHSDSVISFPQSILITETPDRFIVELIGSRRNNRELKVLKHSIESLDLYFGQFERPESQAIFNLLGDGSSIQSMAMVATRAKVELDRRFPYVSSLFLSQIQWAGEGDVYPFHLGPNANFFRVENTLLVNSLRSHVRIRNVQLSVVVLKSTSPTEYLNYLTTTFPIGSSTSGMESLPRGKAEVIQKAAQFANIFLMNQLRETSIGSFIEQHRVIMLSALNATDLISEPELAWQVESPDPEEEAINPDLFIRRADGFWDVYDLKLPLLERRSLTTGRRNRRRFIHPIEDGVAQLAHYREFLSIPEHAQLAREKYGVEFSEPHYGLVVGNFENVNEEQMAEAARRLGEFELIDYDTLLQLYVGAMGINPID